MSSLDIAVCVAIGLFNLVPCLHLEVHVDPCVGPLSAGLPGAVACGEGASAAAVDLLELGEGDALLFDGESLVVLL